MNSRHHAREVALQILYRYDLALHSGGTPAPMGTELIHELQKHFNHFQVLETLRPFVAQLVAGTLQELTQLDQILEKHASNWKIARMASLDRTILRMACYELQYIQDTPAPVTIDEAIELSKQFGTAETPAFVNGILDAIRSGTKKD